MPFFGEEMSGAEVIPNGCLKLCWANKKTELINDLNFSDKIISLNT